MHLFKKEHKDPDATQSGARLQYLHGHLKQLLTRQWNCSSFRKTVKTVYRQR